MTTLGTEPQADGGRWGRFVAFQEDEDIGVRACEDKGEDAGTAGGDRFSSVIEDVRQFVATQFPRHPRRGIE